LVTPFATDDFGSSESAFGVEVKGSGYR